MEQNFKILCRSLMCVTQLYQIKQSQWNDKIGREMKKSIFGDFA